MFSVLKEVNVEELRQLYWGKEKSLGEIAKISVN